MDTSIDIQVNSDSMLVIAILDGKKNCYEKLVQRYQKMVYGIAWSQLGNVDMAEEAVQQSFVKAYCYLATLQDTSKFRPWLARITQNVSVSLGRKRSKELSNSERWHLQPAITEGNDISKRQNLTEELRETLGNLKNTHRQILTLFYLEAKSIKEVSVTLELSESAIKTRLSRARKALRHKLEKRMAKALDNLAPSHNLVPLVMLKIPSGTPIGASVKLAILNNAAGVTIKTSLFSWLTLISWAPFFLIIYLSSKEEAANFHEGKEHDFRRTIMLNNYLNISLIVIVVLLISNLFIYGFGPQTLLQLLCTLNLFALWQGIRFLRVNNSKYSVGQVIILSIYSLAFLLIVFFNFDIRIFVIAVVLSTLVLYPTLDSIPKRMDYNLFLRAANDGLSIAVPINESSYEYSSSQLVQFAKFLGQHWLISDYQLISNGLRVFLPPVKQNLFNSFIPPGNHLSKVDMSYNGRCEAFLTSTEAKIIEKLTQVEINSEYLIENVQNALINSLHQFASGNLELAAQYLCQINDSQVFKKKLSKTTVGKWSFRVTIFVTVLWAIKWYITH